MSAVRIVEKYGVLWSNPKPLVIELAAIRMGGKWVTDGEEKGMGMAYHMRKAIELFAPSYWWNRWTTQQLELYCDHKELSLLGGASTGKTGFMAITGLCEYFAAPNWTSVILSSTSLMMLEKRIWGELKGWFNGAKRLHPWLPGIIIGSAKAIYTSPKDADEGRDERNGIFCVACRVGGREVGLANYVGTKNRVVRLKADEGSYMSKAFLEGANNLDSNPDFKITVSGNPNSTRDALGIISEPKGGWSSIVQTEKTQVWKTKRARGIAIQLVGTDSPALDLVPGDPLPAPLINRQKIEDTITNYGRDSREFSREVLGHIHFGENQRIIITRDLCETNRSMEAPSWDSSPVRIGHADISYSGIGGDRTVLEFSSFGRGANGKSLYALEETLVFDKVNLKGEPVEQSAFFCRDECIKRGVPPERFSFDGSGRSMFTNAIGKCWSPGVVSIEFGGKASDRTLGKTVCNQKFDRFVTELWFAVREVVLSGQFRGMTTDLIDEGSAREYVEKAQGGHIVQSILPKDKIKEILGFSPDKFDALVCGVELARRLGFRIDFQMPVTATSRYKWIKTLSDAVKDVYTSTGLKYG